MLQDKKRLPNSNDKWVQQAQSNGSRLDLTCLTIGHDDKHIHIQIHADGLLDGKAAVSSTHVHVTHPGDDVLQTLVLPDGERLKSMAESHGLQKRLMLEPLF